MSLQNEWQRVCPIVPGAGLMLGPVEEALKSFLFTLLEVGRDERGNLRELRAQSQNAWIGIYNPTNKYAAKCFETSQDCVSYLTSSLKHGNEIDVDWHAKVARNVHATCVLCARLNVIQRRNQNSRLGPRMVGKLRSIDWRERSKVEPGLMPYPVR